MATKKYTLTNESELTFEQKEMLRKAAARPIVYDEENPPLTAEQLAKFRRVHEEREEGRRKQNVTLRLSVETIQKAKALGKGYTGIMSRIIEGVMNDPAALEKYL